MLNKTVLPALFQPFHCSDLQRLGKPYDGGYLVNKHDIRKSNTLVSFGVDDDVSFEKQFVGLQECLGYLYDRESKIDHANDLRLQIIKKHVVRDVSAQEVFKGLDDVFLKCDIEGDEYFLLNYLINHYKQFTGAVIEFHQIEKQERLQQVANFIAKFRLPLVHIHINNWFFYKLPEISAPSVIELTFSSSENLSYKPDLNFPHALDMPNNPDDADFDIKFVGELQ